MKLGTSRATAAAVVTAIGAATAAALAAALSSRAADRLQAVPARINKMTSALSFAFASDDMMSRVCLRLKTPTVFFGLQLSPAVSWSKRSRSSRRREHTARFFTPFSRRSETYDTPQGLRKSRGAAQDSAVRRAV